MGFWNDFKSFIAKSKVADLAIAVAVGGSFGKIVTSLVNDIIMPIISAMTGGASISDWKWVITPANEAAGIAESSLRYGFFIQTILDFLIISLFIYIIFRLIQRSKNQFEQITNGFKRKNKGKSEQKIEIPPQDTLPPAQEIVTTEKSESNKNEIILSMAKMSEQAQKTNKAQENLLREIRDLLKK